MPTYIFRSASDKGQIKVDFKADYLLIRREVTGENIVADYQDIKVASVIPMKSGNYGLVLAGRLGIEINGTVRLRTIYTLSIAKGSHKWDKDIEALKQVLKSNTPLVLNSELEQRAAERIGT